MSRTSKKPILGQWGEGEIDLNNRVSIPGFTLEILREEPMAGQRVIVMLGGKKGIRRIVTEHSLRRCTFPPHYDWLPFKILDRLSAENSQTVEG